jgi:hypothetical protein
MAGSCIGQHGPAVATAVLLCRAAVALAAGVTKVERVSVSSAGIQGNDGSLRPLISADGRVVAFVSRAENLVPGDTKRSLDVFVAEPSLNAP